MNFAGHSRFGAIMACLFMFVTAAVADEAPPLDFPRDVLGQAYPGLEDVTETPEQGGG